MVSPDQPWPPGHQELAEILRRDIHAGRLAPGAPIPSDRWLEETYGIGRNTVRAAVTLLRAEGLVVRRHGQATRVRQMPVKQPIDLAGVTRIEVRMPSPDDRDRLRVPDLGVPVFEVHRRPGVVELLPGDRWFVPAPGAS
ncbi:winged helix-turn-helix domain-containing protein [Micromonospora sp. FIMYZ51]|uniref:GntR family transcriptional regulator n=1 Tax=Micromonospora sp. FIMYZ51 TaxID=3051832 RepID=UPI00311EBF0F